ncbi:MAG: hypothetical protein IJS13_00635 [Paludibacteraceae bacterium]|nr:hypothetical protein [Paludibacteraceae bacterium]
MKKQYLSPVANSVMFISQPMMVGESPVNPIIHIGDTPADPGIGTD